MSKRYKLVKRVLLTAVAVLALLQAVTPPACAVSVRDVCLQAEQQIVDHIDKDKLCTEGGTTPADWFILSVQRSLGGMTAAAQPLHQAVDAAYEAGGFKKVTDCQRIALALLSCGQNPAAAGRNKNRNLLADGAYASSMLEKGGINAYAFGLILLDAAGTELPENARYSRATIVSALLNRQLSPSGGFALTGQTPDVDVTAMVICALVPYYQSDSKVAVAVERALGFLSTVQQASGGFKSYGVITCESTAQVLIALSALGISQERDARFIKNGKTVLDGLLSFQNRDGGFAHTAGGMTDGMATAQAMCGLVATARLAEGKSGLYAFCNVAHNVYRPKAAETSSKASAPLGTSSGGIQKNSSANVSGQTVSGTVPSQQAEHSAITTDSEAGQTAIQSIDSMAAGQQSKNNSVSIKTIIFICLLGLAGMTVTVFVILLKKGFPLSGKTQSRLLAATAALVVAAILLQTVQIQSVSDYYAGQSQDNTQSGQTVTLSIDCNVLFGKDDLPEQLKPYIPADCIIVPRDTYALHDGDTVFDLLCRAAAQHKIPLDYSGGGAKYLRGIGHIYEFACGELSGWVYTVNGVITSKSCSEQTLTNGDSIAWKYTLDLGNDIDAG